VQRTVSRVLIGGSLLFLAALISCAGAVPAGLGIQGDRLAACPSSPNCVCSDSNTGQDVIAPLVLSVPPAKAWPAIRKAVTAMPRCQIIQETDNYVHAECRSAIFRFVDDLEIQLRPDEGIAAVRSASRTGYSDMGVNRKRVESLRADLVAAGVVRAEEPSTR
jgi:uncharacterized protein (DUF1499 family)